MSETPQSDRPLAVATRQLETDRVIVTEWRFPPGTHTGWHVHGYDYVVVPITNGQLLLETPDGSQRAELVAGQSYSRGKGVEHDVINDTDKEVVFVEIELKP